MAAVKGSNSIRFHWFSAPICHTHARWISMKTENRRTHGLQDGLTGRQGIRMNAMELDRIFTCTRANIFNLFATGLGRQIRKHCGFQFDICEETAMRLRSGWGSNSGPTNRAQMLHGTAAPSGEYTAVPSGPQGNPVFASNAPKSCTGRCSRPCPKSIVW